MEGEEKISKRVSRESSYCLLFDLAKISSCLVFVDIRQKVKGKLKEKEEKENR